MLYRLVYFDRNGNKNVQYGQDAVHKRPHFIGLETAELIGNKVTIHTQLSTAYEGIRRYNEDSPLELDIMIEYAKSEDGPWFTVVSDARLATHLDTLAVI